MEKSLGKERRSQEKISIFCESSCRCNSLPSNNPRSFRRKSDWSIFARQCDDPQRLPQVYLSRRKCSRPALHYLFRIETGGRDAKRERQAVFFTAVDPMAVHLHEQREFDLSMPRIAFYKQQWKVHQNAVYWINTRLAQRKGLTFYQMRSNAIILHDTLTSFCNEKRWFLWCLKKWYTTRCMNHHVQRQRTPREIIDKRIGNIIQQQAAGALYQSN